MYRPSVGKLLSLPHTKDLAADEGDHDLTNGGIVSMSISRQVADFGVREKSERCRNALPVLGFFWQATVPPPPRMQTHLGKVREF